MKTLIACALTAMICAGAGLAGYTPVRHPKPVPVKTVLVCAFTPSPSTGATATGMLCVSRPTK